MIVFSHVSLTRQERTILDDLCFAVHPGECVCILGNEGSGKTSLLRLLTGEGKPMKGSVIVDDVNIHTLSPSLLRAYHQSIGIIEENAELLPDRSLARNVALPLEIRGMRKRAIAEKVAERLAEVGLLALAGSFPGELTRGERQKAALARALIAEPKILIADEPTGGLDLRSTQEILLLLRRAYENGATLLLATRSPATAVKFRARTIDLTRSPIPA